MLAPHCLDNRCEIVGSLRRKKETAGDIEILFVGLQGNRTSYDLFTTEAYDLAAEIIDTAMRAGVIAKRPSKTGIFSWGDKNKLGIHIDTGIPVDFFVTTEACWWNALVCRTGGKANNLLITTTARRQGWKFEAYGSGFVKLDGSDRHDTTSERDVYEFIGLKYPEPEERL